MRFSSLAQWLTWQEVCHPLGIDLGLERVSAVAQRLGLIEAARRRKVITIAGTNGKGSCVRSLEALMELQGERYASYTSPHIVCYNERIRLQGQMASDMELCRAFDAVDQVRGELTLTYFEFGTLAAMWLFDQWQVDYWIIEVGLGGRLDAANIIDPDIAVITSIDLDHTEWLGSTRELIGAEKAGICRSNKPLICVDPDPPQSVLACVKRLECPFVSPSKSVFSNARIQLAGHSYELSRLKLPPPSVVAALLVMQQLQLLGAVAPASVQESIDQVGLPGRLQEFELAGRKIWLDVAHNPAAVRFCVESLKTRFADDLCGGVNVVLAMMKDKDHEACILSLQSIATSWSVCDLANNPRAQSATELMGLFGKLSDRPVKHFASVTDALATLPMLPNKSPALVVGSFFTVAEATEYLTRCLELEESHENLG